MMKKNLLILMTLCVSIIGYSQTFTENFITYQVLTNTSNVTITNYDPAGGTVVDIPATVTNNSNTYNITIINTTAFSSKGLTNVTIPNSVLIIGDLAFTSNQLTSIIIPANVTSIGSFAFQSNPLTSITSLGSTPPNIISGTNDSFGNRSNIDLSIPSGTASAYAAATWTGFNSVTEATPLAVGDTFIVDFITYEVTSLTPDTVKGINYDVAGGTMVNIPSSVSNSAINFSVTTIGVSAFNNKNLTSVSIPNGLLSTGNLSFANNQLTSIIIPDSVTILGSSTFYNNNLTSVTLSNNLTVIGGLAFGVNFLTDINIPNSVTIIGSAAFTTNNLVNVSIPNSVTNIQDSAFRLNQLTSITIPNSVTTIENNAFRDNPLTDVTSLATTPPTITTASTGFADTFNNDRSSIHLHIPAGTMGAYVTDAGALWTGFNPVSEDALLSTSNLELANEVIIVTTANQIEVISSSNIRLEQYAIYTISGAKVKKGKESIIDTDDISSGIYIIELNFDKGRLAKKVIVN